MSRNNGSSTQTQVENLRPVEIELDGTQNNCRCESCQYQGRRRQVNSVNWLSEDGKQTPWHNMIKSLTSDNDATNNAIAPNTLETSSRAASSTLGKASTSTDFTIDTNITEPAITTSTNLTVPAVICSQKDVSTVSTTSHCPIEPASTESDDPETQEELVNRSIPLPGSRDKKIWHFQTVCSQVVSPEDYNSRFTCVVHELKKAVDEHDTLRDRARFIDYDLRMVGTSLQAAKPSIIVKCNRKDVTSLRSLFKHTAGLRLCSPGETSIRSRLFHDSVRSRNAMFQLYYFPSNSNPTMHFAGEVANIVTLPSGPTMCGALAEHQGLHATIGLTLVIDEIDHLLTVNHLFRHDTVNEQAKTSMNISTPRCATLSEEDDSASSTQEDDDSWFNDDDDDDEEQIDMHQDFSELKSPHINQHAVSNTTLGDRQVSSTESSERAAKSTKLGYAKPYLDWACLSPKDVSIESRRFNYLIRDEKPNIPLQKVTSSPRMYATPVYMISGISGTRCGTLLAARSYLGSLPGQALCEVWTVVIDGGIVPGECGSIIVDLETFHVYGHVVGCDVVGHARIVPLSTVMDQIKSEFAAKTVDLPDVAPSYWRPELSQSQRLNPYPKSLSGQSAYYLTWGSKSHSRSFVRSWLENEDLPFSLETKPASDPDRFSAVVANPSLISKINSGSSNIDSAVFMSSEEGADRPKSVSTSSILNRHVFSTEATHRRTWNGRRKSWACPFAKKSRLHSHRCHNKALSVFSSVKHHLLTEHDSSQRDNELEMLTFEQRVRIADIAPAAGARAGARSWNEVFHILFPADELPDDPFVQRTNMYRVPSYDDIAEIGGAFKREI